MEYFFSQKFFIIFFLFFFVNLIIFFKVVGKFKNLPYEQSCFTTEQIFVKVELIIIIFYLHINTSHLVS